MEYKIWLEPDKKTGQNFIKFSGKLLLDSENLKWISGMASKVDAGWINYINPLFSSNPQENEEVSLGLWKVDSSNEIQPSSLIDSSTN